MQAQSGTGVVPDVAVKPVYRLANQRCNDCGRVFVNLANHKKCSKRVDSGGETVQEGSRRYK